MKILRTDPFEFPKQSAGGPGSYECAYDYRTRRVELGYGSDTTKVVFSGGVSVREFLNTAASVDYVRGSDWGGGVGGILYTKRGGVPSFTHYNGRGDVTAKTSAAGAITYQSTYEGFGKVTNSVGTTPDRQKSNVSVQAKPPYPVAGSLWQSVGYGASKALQSGRAGDGDRDIP